MHCLFIYLFSEIIYLAVEIPRKISTRVDFIKIPTDILEWQQSLEIKGPRQRNPDQILLQTILYINPTKPDPY